MESTLLTTSQVLDRLSGLIPAQDLPGQLAKILRVPIAWDSLQNISVLEAACKLLPAKTLSPALVAAVCMDLDELPSADSSLEDEVEAELDQVWERARTDGTPPQNLYQTALLSIALNRESMRAGAADEIAEWVLAHPLVWRSALACNWLSEPQQGDVIKYWLTKGTRGFSLAAFVLLSNFSTEESAHLLLDIGGLPPGHLLQLALETEETSLAASIDRLINQGSLPAKTHSLDSLMVTAMGSIARGAGDHAKSALGAAWEMTSKLAGDVADWIAITAERNDEPIVASEAWSQALEIQPTPYRRARLALCYHELGRTEEALDLISADSGAPEECIALGLIQSERSRKAALEVLSKAVRAIQKDRPPQPTWMLKLVDTLALLGETKTALAQISALKDWHPPDVNLFNNIGEVYLIAGESDKAVAAGQLAHKLDPMDDAARRLLGRAYDQAGEHASAVQIWEPLAESHPEYRLDLASASLKAEDSEKALQVAIDFLEDQPASLEAKTIVGKALIQLGQHEEALHYLEEAVASAPQSPQAWLALAGCQNALSDYEAARQTIQSGLEAIPDSGELHFRLAQMLVEDDQLEGALQHSKRAIDGDEASARYYAFQAQILERLDLPQEALSAHEEAFRIQPNNWSYRVGLAEAYADQDKTSKAVELLEALPSSADAQAHALAARAFSVFALDDHDEYYEKALDRLDLARQLNANDTWLTLQQARILERLGRPGPAFFAYRQYVNLAQGQADEDLLEAVLGVSRTALDTDQAVVAIATLEQGQQSFPESTEVLQMLAPAYMRAGMNQRALAVARQAVNLSPNDPALLKLLSEAAAQNQNWDEAIESLEKLVSDDEHSPDTWLAIADVSISAERVDKARQSIAHVLNQSGRADADLLQQASSLVERMHQDRFAMRLLKRAFTINNDKLELVCRLGQLSMKLEDLEMAQSAWLRASELEPEQVEYLDQGAAAAWRLGRRSSAIGLWQRAAMIEPENAPIQKKLAHALLENGEVEKSLERFHQALELEPENHELLLEAGQVISQFGSPDGALSIYHRALSLDPDSVEAKLGSARCHLLMNAPDKAREILEDILNSADQDHVQSQAHAMLALAALQMGDLPVAARSFQNAKAVGEANREQDIWLSRTALRMGRWEDALEILDRDQIALTPERVNEQLTCRLRIEDARSLYHAFANAGQHAPKVVEAHNRGQIAELAAWLEDNVSFAPWLEDSRTWIEIQRENTDPDALMAAMVDKAPRPELVHALAISLIRNQRTQQALQLLDQTALPFDTDLWGVLLRGICQLDQNKPSLARETLQFAAENPVISPIATYFIGKSWLADGEQAQALSDLNKAVSAWPEEAAWHYELAMLYLDSQRSDAALPHFQRAAEIEPKNTVYTLAYARCLREAGYMPDAQSAFAHLIHLGDPTAEVLREAGLVALANGDLEHAQHWLSEVATKQPDDAKSLIGAARAAHRLGDKTRAQELSQSAYRLAPNDVLVLTGMAEIEAGRGKLEHALAYFDQALESSEDQVDIHIARSRLLLENKRPTEAIDSLEHAATLDPNDDHVLSLLAAAYENLGKYDQAMTVASRAHTIAPLRPIHRLQLGRISRKAGQLDRAVDELSRAEQDHPTDPAFPLELGKAYEARAQHKRALESYQRAISLNPTVAEPYYRTGVLLKSRKAYAQACQMFERAAELDPNDADILHQLAAVRAISLVHGGITKSVVSR
jgi:tetratricopeptide (TPR) repeat protein